MNKVEVPNNYNYAAVFLTLGCNLTCSYCINHDGELKSKRPPLSAEEWILGLTRLNLKNNLAITFQGGEPSIHRGFYDILKDLAPKIQIDLLTNLQFNPTLFAAAVNPIDINRNAPYAPIRVSYHPETMSLQETIDKGKQMQELGFSIGFYGVLHPDYRDEILMAQNIFKSHGLDFRTKEFLGSHQGKYYGTIAYKDAVDSSAQFCQCKTTELLIAPDGYIHRCHHDLYKGILPIGHILDPKFKIDDVYRPCEYYGKCNPCDVKVKNNRFQHYGHTSVEIKDIFPLEKRPPEVTISNTF